MADGNDLPPKLYIIEKDDPGRDSGGPRYRLTRWRDLMIKPGPRTLVDGLIPAKGNVTVVAGWNGGKSVFASNLALCVAAGLPFAGLTTLQGPVVYNVGEGNGSFVRRLFAAGQRLGIANGTDLPLFILDEAPDFGHDPDPALKYIDSIAQQIGRAPALVVNDTLHRHLGGGDDSDGTDMSNYSRNTKLIEDRFECAVMSLHHPGHSAKNRGRGHSSWIAGIDTEFLITGERRDIRVVTVSKDRDLNALDLTMSFEIVPEGVEANGETVSAPVMEIVKEWHASDRIAAGTEQPKPKASSNGLTSYQQTLYDAFIEALAEHGQAAPASFGLPARTKVVHKRHLIAEAKARGFYCDEKGEHKNFRSRLNETIATLGRKGLVRSRGIGTDYYLWLVK